MLPFLAPKKMVSVIVAKRKASGEEEVSHEEGSQPPELLDAAAELIKAVHAKDETAVANCLENAFKCLESKPHVEGPEIEDEA